MNLTQIFFFTLGGLALFTSRIFNCGDTSQIESPHQASIYLTIQLKDQIKDSITIHYHRKATDSLNQEYVPVTSAVIQGRAKFEINSAVPVNLYTANIFPSITGWIAEPGDSIYVVITEESIDFSGKGSEKYRLLVSIDSAKRTIPAPINSNNHNTSDLADFLHTHDYLKQIEASCLSTIEYFRPKISQEIYASFRVGIIKRMQENRLDKFGGLTSLAYKHQLSFKDLCTIFDSTFNSPDWHWALSQSEYLGGWYAYARAIVAREHNFDYSSDSMKDAGKRRILYYNRGKQLFTGLSRELFLVDLVTHEGVGELGFTPEVKYLLSKYYKEPGYPAHKEYVRRYEEKKRLLKAASVAPEFTLKDTNDRIVTLEDYAGKLILLDFWFTGCPGCIQMVPALSQVEEKFRDDSNIVFLNVSTDTKRTNWLKSVSEQKYTTGSGTSLYTNGQGTEHPMIKDYSITSYPSLFLINELGRIVQNPLPDPRNDLGDSLSSIISERLEYLKDGPYIVHRGDSVDIFTLHGKYVTLNKKHIDSTIVKVSIGQSEICFPLKKRHTAQPSTFPTPSNIFAVSDIEGNLKAFTKLLKVNHIIDDNLAWNFGDGHLMLVGDFFDRGEQVTECLWLIYSLEEQAKKAGGYVHFILGNHEIMNLAGDTNYVQEKYRKNSSKIGIPYTSLYGPQTELGRWLRTKNIMEKIGDMLIVHGGISKEVNETSLSIEEINNLAREYYDKKVSDNPSASIIMNSPTSPLWYRLYYLSTEKRVDGRGNVTWKATQDQVDQTCSKFKVTKIITGHTIVGDSITTHFNGKVVNVDTQHANGFSEALLIVENQFYRTNQQGKVTQLFQNKH